MKKIFALLIGILIYHNCFSEEVWKPSLTYEQVVLKAKAGSPYYMGLLGIFLRSGEAGCSVNLSAAEQWSKAALKKGHPFGSYNLANLAMLNGDFAEATRLYQDAALLFAKESL